MKIEIETFLWGAGVQVLPPFEGFHCLTGHIEKSDVKNLREYTELVRTLVSAYGWDFQEKTTNLLADIPKKQLQKFKMPSKAVIKKYYDEFVVNQGNLK